MLKAKNINKSFGSLDILKGINLEINQGEIVSIVGSSGAGKTTLLQILGTLTSIDSGELYYKDRLVSSLNQKQISKFRNENIGFVFQFHHLLPEFTAIENVMLPSLIKGDSKPKATQRAEELLEKLNLSDRLHHKPSQLSGGEQQRVSTARALVNSPEIIFADEPSGNLDSQNAQDLHQLFFDLRKEINQTFVIVTHDEHLAGLCDRTISIRDGILF